jgi:replicative DNA helicase
MGKTAFCLNIAAYAAIEKGKSVAIFSLEMAKEQLVLRLLGSESRVDAHKLRTGHLSQSDWTPLSNAAGRLAETKIFIDDTAAISVLEVRAKARRLKADKGSLDLIIVDYLQLMRGRGDEGNREQEISGISRSLKALAKELRVPVIALSQLNRAVETRPGREKRPMLADLRESGAVEQDADVVLFIYRDEVYHKCDCPYDGECLCGQRGKAEVIIGKQRNGPIGKVDLTFISRFTRFENAEKRNV